MAIREYLETHQAFSAVEFRHAFPDSVTDRNLLARAVRSGGVDRVRNGVYVSKSGPFSRSQADPLDVARAAAQDATFCLLSALRLHGVLHNVVTVTQFYTSHKITPFEYAGQHYQPRRLPARDVDTCNLFTTSGRSYPVTTREQTLLDCLARPGLAGGPDNLLRSLSGFAYLDIASFLARPISGNTSAKLGWLLENKREEWRVDDTTLATLKRNIGAGPYYFWSSRPPKDRYWVNRWRLYLPHPEQEMITWLNQ
ncbi:MAG: hypothetical protein LBE83_02910 [Propionibacteriaceae bacterium]|jgi:predicted transcriptional regulator of viral defense system|nr:hypothetical protein [Propionibacteriaceae bacterium]